MISGIVSSLYWDWNYARLVDDKEDEENSEADYHDSVMNAIDDESDDVILLD